MGSILWDHTRRSQSASLICRRDYILKVIQQLIGIHALVPFP